jgi:hypothetical protein
MSEEGNEHEFEDEETSQQSSLVPWSSPAREARNTSEESEPDSDADLSEQETTGDRDTESGDQRKYVSEDAIVESVDWTRRELSESYPVDANYHCNECNSFASDSISELKTHVETEEVFEWSEYLLASRLHRCAGCETPLSTLSDLYCGDCQQDGNDRIPCRNCGAVRVNVSNPFCSAACAGERLPFGPPLARPREPGDDWLDHPHRLPTGIPTAAPFIENHRLACRDCYLFGADGLHKFAVHVSEAHERGWDGYIHRYALRRCRVCRDPLESLLPIYCSDKCQHSDPHPFRVCKLERCETGVERRQKFCSWNCYTKAGI